MPRYDYSCDRCKKVEERDVPVEERDSQQCECGCNLKRIFAPNANIQIPIAFRAGNDTASQIMPSDAVQEKTWRDAGVRRAGQRWV